MIQVISFSHPLSSMTMNFVRSLDKRQQVRTYRINLHITRFDRTTVELDEIFDKLRREGCDLSGRTRTLLVPPGSSTAAMAITAAWMGLTGDLPEILNLIRRGDQVHGPSPEAPTINLDSWADEKMEQNPELVKLHSIKSQIRKSRVDDAPRNEILVR